MCLSLCLSVVSATMYSQSQPVCVEFTGEFAIIDHIVFIVHGLGPAADSRHQSVVDCGKDS